MRTVKILIYEPAEIIIAGIKSILRQILGKNIEIFELVDYNNIIPMVFKYQPDIVLLDMSLVRTGEVRKFKKQHNGKYVALQHSIDHSFILNEFDEVITVFDNAERVKSKLSKLMKLSQRDMPEESLSIREEEVLVEIVNGMTNKEIAQKLNISINTVTTHRRNISSKLQIHTIAGLTIYAISNRLIKVKE